MKILLVDPNNDGPNITYPLVRFIRDLGGVDIELVSSFNRFHSKHYDKNFSCEPRYFFFRYENRINSKRLRQLLKAIDYPFYNLSLLVYVLKDPPDIIHYNWIKIPVIDYVFMVIFKSLGIKIVLTQHNYYQHNRRKLRPFEKRIFHAAERIICLSNYVKNQFGSEFGEKVVLIEHGNCYEQDIDFYRSRLTRDDGHRDFRILFSGIIKKYKGVELLLDSMEILVSDGRHNDISVTIAGLCSKEYSRRIRASICSKNLDQFIDFIPVFLSNKELYNLVYNTDMGVLPYLEATQSGIPYIYFSLHRPIVVTNVGGLPEQVSEKIARIAQPNPRSLAWAILEIKGLLESSQIKETDFLDYLTRFEWAGTSRKYLQNYKEVHSS